MNSKPGHHALRIGRQSQVEGIYLVTFATALRCRIFAEFAFACAVCRTLAPAARSSEATLLCWVLMPDHFRALVRLDGEVPLSAVVQRLKSMSTRACHGIQPEKIAIWARAFHDHALRRDDDLLRTARYIVANPVRAGLVKRASEYPFWDAVWI
ncbi:MAG TPA: transposase [Rhodanobacteraceae bacterium]